MAMQWPPCRVSSAVAGEHAVPFGILGCHRFAMPAQSPRCTAPNNMHRHAKAALWP